MPSGMSRESLGIIGWLFALNGPLEGGIESSFSGTGWGAKGDFRWIFTSIPAFSKAASTILRMHMPSGMGTESLGIIGCIFAENWPLESGIESSFSGTGWGVLRVISGGFFTPIPAFSKAASNIFRMHLPSGMGTENLGIIGCIFAENGPLEAGIESSFSGTGWGAKGDFRWIFTSIPAFSKAASTILRMHMPSGMGTESLGIIGCIFAENWPLESGIESSFSGTGWGVLRVISGGFLRQSLHFRKRPPTFSECTCPQVWAQKIWGSSDVYSRRMGP